MKPSFFLQLLFLINMSAWASGRTTGNGGDSVAQDFVRAAFKAVDVLKRSPSLPRGLNLGVLEMSLTTTQVWSEERVFLKTEGQDSVEKDAINYPDREPPGIAVSRTRWNSPNMSEARKMSISLHEYLGIIGLERNQYQVSQAVMNLLATDPSKPVLLFEQKLGDGRTGLNFTSASEICNIQRELFRQRYFWVYCVYRERSWTELRRGIVNQVGYEFLGYESGSVSSADSSSQRITAYYRNVGASWGNSKSRSSDFDYRKPVILQTTVPRSLLYDETFSVYGLEVYGVGDLLISPWRTVLSSLKIAGELFSFTYPSEFEARGACLDMLIDSKRAESTRLTFRNARCFTERSNEEEFYYEIRSQNPFIPMD